VTRIYDKKNKLIQVLIYNCKNGKLWYDEFYSPKGILIRSVTYWANGNISYKKEVDSITHIETTTEYFETGKIKMLEETPTDSFDAVFKYYYSTGELKIDGFKREVYCYRVESYDKDSVGSFYNGTKKDSILFKEDVGLSHYYYKNGKDSIVGSYFYGDYYMEAIDGNNTIYAMASHNKDGKWFYYSPEGKIICEEEWNKGNLISRKTF
jgi:antitoxin component YwqK of YwqJK toxin-antitoxin module